MARRHSSLANFAATLAPGFLRKRVETDFVTQLRQQLIEHGILAEVLIEPDPPENSR